MQVIADTNVLVAAFLRKGATREILFSKKLEIFSPDKITAEMLVHKEEFKQKGNMTEREFHEALELLLENITIIPVEDYGSLKRRALAFCPEGHQNDWPFFALALKLNCPLWSNDKALKSQPKVVVYSTTELLDKI